MSQYILGRPGFKSTAENSTHHPSQLPPAERARRMAELRQLLRVPAFQALVRDAEHGRDQS